jgi:acyl-coenzyme A thioesterase PaaI-like protein
MATADAAREALVALNASAAFNRWAGFELGAVAPGAIELRLPWRGELGQYAGFLHAALIGAMIDTACGFAAYAQVGNVLASHFSVSCLAPAVGDLFIARARIVKAGRRQVFAAAELFASRAGVENLVATGETILVPIEAAA